MYVTRWNASWLFFETEFTPFCRFAMGNKVEAFLFIFPFVVTDLRMVLLQSTNSDCKPYPPHLKAVLVLVQEKIQVDSGLNQKMKS